MGILSQGEGLFVWEELDGIEEEIVREKRLYEVLFALFGVLEL